MEYRTLDISISSLEGMKTKKVKSLLFKTRIYAEVSILTTASVSRQKTPLGTFRRKNYEWDYFPMRFYPEESKLQQNSLMLMIQLRKKRLFHPENDVGQVCVPLKELFDDPQNDILNCPACLGVYPVLTASGKHKGYLYFSYKFSKTFQVAVGNGGNDDVSRLKQLGSTAQAVVSEPSAPYIDQSQFPIFSSE